MVSSVHAAAQLILQDDEMLVAESDDQVHLAACLVQRLCLRIGNRHAQTAADDRRALDALGMARLTQRADEIQQRVALVAAYRASWSCSRLSGR